MSSDHNHDHNRKTTTHLNDGEGLKIAHPEDFGVKRNDNEELEAVAQQIPGTDLAIKCKPLVDGALERWEDVLEGEKPDDERVDEFLQTYVEEGIGSDGLGDVPEYVVPGLIEAVKRGSGYEVFQRMQEAEMEENLAALEAMDDVPEGLLERAMDMEREQRDTSDA